MKNVVIGVLALAVAYLGYTLYGQDLVSKPATTATTTASDDTQVCIQVVTAARDPKTGLIKEFPTPCDVPEGWEVVQNDIPGFDLEVQ